MKTLVGYPDDGEPYRRPVWSAGAGSSVTWTTCTTSSQVVSLTDNIASVNGTTINFSSPSTVIYFRMDG